MCVTTFTMPVHLHGAYVLRVSYSSLEDATTPKQASFWTGQLHDMLFVKFLRGQCRYIEGGGGG